MENSREWKHLAVPTFPAACAAGAAAAVLRADPHQPTRQRDLHSTGMHGWVTGSQSEETQRVMLTFFTGELSSLARADLPTWLLETLEIDDGRCGGEMQQVSQTHTLSLDACPFVLVPSLTAVQLGARLWLCVFCVILIFGVRPLSEPTAAAEADLHLHPQYFRLGVPHSMSYVPVDKDGQVLKRVRAVCGVHVQKLSFSQDATMCAVALGHARTR